MTNAVPISNKQRHQLKIYYVFKNLEDYKEKEVWRISRIKEKKKPAVLLGNIAYIRHRRSIGVKL